MFLIILESMSFFSLEAIIVFAILILVGMLLGWFLWGGKSKDCDDCSSHESEIARLKKENKELKEKQNSSDLKAKRKTATPAKEAKKAAPKKAAPTKKSDIASSLGIVAATAKDKDDLKVIKGVGPGIEKRLNGIGIFTYAQIGGMNKATANKVNEAIEFFPGRIERDEWVKQAKKLAEK